MNTVATSSWLVDAVRNHGLKRSSGINFVIDKTDVCIRYKSE
ncbi:hypothetical protein OWA11_00280 [Acidithiobacillus ferriphilus]|nr:hypothetical protein [Acidithiobacillus ferriphilus]